MICFTADHTLIQIIRTIHIKDPTMPKKFTFPQLKMSEEHCYKSSNNSYLIMNKFISCFCKQSNPNLAFQSSTA